MKHLNWLWLYHMILAWQWIKIWVKKKLKSIYFKFTRLYDFYAFVTKGLKWFSTVSITLVGRINLLWKQIDVPVGFGCKLYIYTQLLCKMESAVRKIKINIVFEIIDFQWGFNAIFMVPFSHYFNPWKCQRTSHKIHFIGYKNAVKRSEKYSENLHGPLKIPC